jgi:predicted transcriptional regulator
MDYLRVDGHANLLRDSKTNSIINDNMSEYKEYLSRKNIKNVENQKIQNIEGDIVSMKDDINEIKNLLRGLVNGS